MRSVSFTESDPMHRLSLLRGGESLPEGYSDTGYVRTYEFKKTVRFLEPGFLLWQCADN